MYGRETLQAESPEWSSLDSTALIAASRGAIASIRVVGSGRVLVNVDSKDDVCRIRGLMEARGLKIIEQSV